MCLDAGALENTHLGFLSICCFASFTVEQHKQWGAELWAPAMLTCHPVGISQPHCLKCERKKSIYPHLNPQLPPWRMFCLRSPCWCMLSGCVCVCRYNLSLSYNNGTAFLLHFTPSVTGNPRNPWRHKDLALSSHSSRALLVCTFVFFFLWEIQWENHILLVRN